MNKCSDDALGRVIYLTALEMRNLAEKKLKPFDLTLEQLQVLKTMSCEEGLAQRRIGELANKTPTNITRILDRLEGKGLVSRQDNPMDRRALLVFLTDAGAEMLDKVYVVFELFSDELFRGVSDEEQAIIRSSFKKMSRNIERMNERLIESSL
ncbi:MAG: MarR family transcriptional regulator [Desulfobulbaceae bacterium]|nr:MarR family transcriptional regulator [Desulfobulbaceae bacterium]